MHLHSSNTARFTDSKSQELKLRRYSCMNYPRAFSYKDSQSQVARLEKRIRNSLDLDSAKTIAISFIHSKLDYCNSLYINLPSHFINRLQLIKNAAARAVTHTRKSAHITPILKSLHWLKVPQRIHFKIISLTMHFSSADLHICTNYLKFMQYPILCFAHSKNDHTTHLDLKLPIVRSTFKLPSYKHRWSQSVRQRPNYSS
jgi:uncharacterized protein involved in tolerance to divalent cations